MSRTITLLLLVASVSGCGVEYELGADELVPWTEPVVSEAPIVDAEPRIRDLDVLVVLDGSGSMSDDREAVSRGIVQLKHDIEDRADVWGITFLTADPAIPAYIGPFGPEDSDADLKLAPGMLPVNGGERPFGAAYNFLRNHPNHIHPGRDLLLFVVTDEDEQTTGISAEAFDDWLDSVKEGSEDRVDVVSIASIDETCSPDVAYKLMELAHIRNSTVVDLCSPDWEGWLAETSFLTAWD